MAATSKNIHLTPSEADALDIDFGNLRTASSMSIRSDNDTVINTEINSNEKPGASPRINLTEKTGTNDGVNIILPNITFPSTNLTLKNKRKRTEDNNQDEENQAKKGKLLIPDEYKDDYTLFLLAAAIWGIIEAADSFKAIGIAISVIGFADIIENFVRNQPFWNWKKSSMIIIHDQIIINSYKYV